MVVIWMIAMIFVLFVPIVMWKNDINIAGKDLFFVFVGLISIGGFSLIGILSNY